MLARTAARTLTAAVLALATAHCGQRPSFLVDGGSGEGGTMSEGGGPDVVPIDTGNHDAMAMPIDGSGVYDVGPGSSSTTCTSGTMGPRMDIPPLGCLDREECGNGSDDNCDGRVDEGCVCQVGIVQPCFLGPPGRRGVGACADGMQVCRGQGEFGCWSECTGGLGVQPETCNGADDNCDGCVDNGLDCRVSAGTCPTGDDPRTPVGRPFQSYSIRGRDLYTGMQPGSAFRWTVEGSPCDQMLFATSGRTTFSLNGMAGVNAAQGENLVFVPTLSGDYQIRLRISGTDGLEFDCTFIVKIRQSGFRAELCWDRTGETDIDLWLHKPNDRTDWVSTRTNTSATCFYGNCRNSSALNWGYAATMGSACREPMGSGTSARCNNPRLDIDNISSEGVPENINVDLPNDGDTFRVAVNYYGNDDFGGGRSSVQPMLNVYCGGQLLGTYGGVVNGRNRWGAEPIVRFDTPGSDEDGSLWRVVDVVYHRDSSGAERCELYPLVRNGTSDPCVITGPDRTFDGDCERASGMPPGPMMGGMCM